MRRVEQDQWTAQITNQCFKIRFESNFYRRASPELKKLFPACLQQARQKKSDTFIAFIFTIAPFDSSVNFGIFHYSVISSSVVKALLTNKNIITCRLKLYNCYWFTVVMFHIYSQNNTDAKLKYKRTSR